MPHPTMPTLGRASVALWLCCAGCSTDSNEQAKDAAIADAAQKPAAGDDGGADARDGAAPGGDGASPGADVDAADFPAMLARAYCATLSDCCPAGTADCQGAVKKQIEDAMASAAEANDVYDGKSARACVDAVTALDNVSCDPAFASRTSALRTCAAVLDGTVAPGDVCNAVTDCRHREADGTIQGGFVGCAQLGGGTDMRCRAFKPTSTEGTACEMGFATEAAEVFVCAGDLVCVDATCQTGPGADEACLQGRCAPWHLCVSDVCKPFAAEGTSCAEVPCAIGLDCDPTTQKCGPATKRPWILSVGFWSTSYECP